MSWESRARYALHRWIPVKMYLILRHLHWDSQWNCKQMPSIIIWLYLKKNNNKKFYTLQNQISSFMYVRQVSASSFCLFTLKVILKSIGKFSQIKIFWDNISFLDKTSFLDQLIIQAVVSYWLKFFWQNWISNGSDRKGQLRSDKHGEDLIKKNRRKTVYHKKWHSLICYLFYELETQFPCSGRSFTQHQSFFCHSWQSFFSYYL